MPSPKLDPVVLSDEERSVLTGWARRRKTAQALALRARIVLRCAEGGSIGEVAGDVGVSRNTVSKWRSRFAEDRLEGLSDEPRPGRPRLITDERVDAVITKTLEEIGHTNSHYLTTIRSPDASPAESAIRGSPCDAAVRRSPPPTAGAGVLRDGVGDVAPPTAHVGYVGGTRPSGQGTAVLRRVRNARGEAPSSRRLALLKLWSSPMLTAAATAGMDIVELLEQCPARRRRRRRT